MGPDHNKEWIKLHVSSSIEGYAYNTQTVAPRIAIAVLMTYCILALAHVFYSGITGIFFDISFCGDVSTYTNDGGP